jgi:Holliday junction resolvasome RuvABC endonuclease subunit
MKTILALDIATNTGWAYRHASGFIEAGAWELQTPAETTAAAKLRKDRTLDARVPLLYRQLKNFWDTRPDMPPGNNPVDFLVFEDVEFSRFTKQTQLWSSLRAAVWLFCYNYTIPRDCCPVGTLKKFATGSGHAMKPQMVAAASALFPRVDFKLDEDAADALCLLQWAITLTNRVK